MIQKEAWAEAKERYETSKVSQTALAKDLGCSRVAVTQRVKRENWLRFEPKQLTKSQTVLPQVRGSKLGLRSDENIRVIVDTYAKTGNKAMACRQVDISRETLRLWCDDSPELLAMLRRARDAHLLGQYDKIAEARDWKAAKEILARSPETKDQWGEVHESGPKIILNIHRDEVIIEQ